MKIWHPSVLMPLLLVASCLGCGVVDRSMQKMVEPQANAIGALHQSCMAYRGAHGTWPRARDDLEDTSAFVSSNFLEVVFLPQEDGSLTV